MCPHFSINQFRVAYSFLPSAIPSTTSCSSIVTPPPPLPPPSITGRGWAGGSMCRRVALTRILSHRARWRKLSWANEVIEFVTIAKCDEFPAAASCHLLAHRIVRSHSTSDNSNQMGNAPGWMRRNLRWVAGRTPPSSSFIEFAFRFCNNQPECVWLAGWLTGMGWAANWDAPAQLTHSLSRSFIQSV